LAPGGLCDAFGKGGDCASGFCSADGICCAETCGGPCQSCKGGKTCSGVPESSRGACTDNDVCSAEGLCHCSNQGFLGPTPRLAYPTGQTPNSLATGDLNGDGKPDLAVANSADDTVGVLINLGNGAFAPQVAYPTGKMSPSKKSRSDIC